VGPNGAVCPGPVLRPSRCSQPHGNGSHLRPNPRRETIEEPIGIYSSRSTRSDIERGGAGALRSRLISRPRRYYLARSRAISRVNRSQPIIRSKRSVYKDMCSTLNCLETPRWADTMRVGSALHIGFFSRKRGGSGPESAFGGRERLVQAQPRIAMCYWDDLASFQTPGG
jgi:hypothetical protein